MPATLTPPHADATRRFEIEQKEFARLQSELHNLKVEASRLQCALNNATDGPGNPLDAAARELLGEQSVTPSGESASSLRTKLIAARERLPILGRAVELQERKVDGSHDKSQLAVGEANRPPHRALCRRLLRSLIEARALNRAEFSFRESLDFPPGLHPLANSTLSEFCGPLTGDNGLASAMIREALQQNLVTESDVAEWQREAAMIVATESEG